MRTASFGLVSLVLCAALALPAWAENDKGHGRGHDGKGEKDGHSENSRGDAGPDRQIVVAPQQQIVIIERDREYVRRYYRSEYLYDRCPPGLAKRDNGCLPPGQAKRAWAVGQSLPPEIVYYEMPRDLYVQLTPPPSGYRYVRVDNDIMMISVAGRVISGLLGNLGKFD